MSIDERASKSGTPYPNRRHQLGLIGLSLCLTLGLLLAACPLSVVAIQHRLIAPPHISVRVGSVEIAAPCPAQGFICDHPLPWYAIWRGDDQPDGSITYRQLYFIYLKPVRRRQGDRGEAAVLFILLAFGFSLAERKTECQIE